MTNERRVLVHPDKQTLAGAVAARFITKVLDLLDVQETVHVVLTGGSMGGAVLVAVRESPEFGAYSQRIRTIFEQLGILNEV